LALHGGGLFSTLPLDTGSTLVARLELDGGGEQTIATIAGDNSVRFVRADDTSLLVRGYDALYSLPLIGGSSTALIPSGIYGSGHFAGTAKNAYIASEPTSIIRVPRGGGGSTPIVSNAVRPFEVEARADDSEVFWLTRAVNDAGGALYHFTASGVVPLVLGLNDPVGLALDDTGVYFGSYSGEITKRHNDGGVERLSATRDAGLGMATQYNSNSGVEYGLLVAYKNHIYWFTRSNDTKQRIQLVRQGACGGPITVLADGFDFPYGIAVDDDVVYFTDYVGIYSAAQ
jgi:hypothetical protein